MAHADVLVEDPLPETEQILWDVMEEYVDEAEYAVEVFESALEDPEYNLEELGEGPEEKLLACVDGLVVGGPIVATKLLVDELERADSEEPSRTTAVVLALLDLDRRDLVAPYFESESSLVRNAASRACGLSTSPKVDPWLLDQVRVVDTSAGRGAILDAMVTRGLQVDSLAASLRSESAIEARAAARMARYADPVAHTPAIASLLSHPDPDTRDAALITALQHGSEDAWVLCERLSFDPAAPNPAAMALFAALGGPPQHERLVDALQSDTLRALALRALGFSGNVAVVDTLLRHLEAGSDEDESKLAAEAIALIAGLDLRDDAFVIEAEGDPDNEDDALPPLEEDLEDDLALRPEDSLPVPNPEAIRQWWKDTGPSLDHNTRHIAGKPWSVSGVAEHLMRGALRDRHIVATGLCIRTNGTTYVDTRAFSARQRAQINAFTAPNSGNLVRKYGQW
ncbi:MAG: hypothetical protein AAF500_22040 [Myxococcota bacterium]